MTQQREPGTIECFIDNCPWTHTLPVATQFTATQDERDDIKVAHIHKAHSVAEIGRQIDRLIEAVQNDTTLIHEQVEDRNAIIQILQDAQINHPGWSDPTGPIRHR